MKKSILYITFLSALMMLIAACDIFNTSDSSENDKKKDTTEQNEPAPPVEPETTTEPETPTEPETLSEPKDFTPTENNVRLLGRTITQDNIAVMAHSATGVEFNVNAKKLSVTFIQNSWDMPVRFVAFFNNERIFDTNAVNLSRPVAEIGTRFGFQIQFKGSARSFWQKIF